MAFTEDLDLFFDDDDFAVSAVINTTPQRTIKAIFSTPTDSVALYEQAIEAPAPFLHCKTSDVSGVRSGKGANTATVAGTSYKIERIEHDGTGTSRLYLKT